MWRLVTRLVINHYMRITEYSFPQSLSSTSPEGKISRKQKSPDAQNPFRQRYGGKIRLNRAEKNEGAGDYWQRRDALQRLSMMKRAAWRANPVL